MDNLNDHTLECPRCGRVFSLELTRCPQCGLNIYPDDEDDPTVGAHGMRPSGMRPDGISPPDVLPDSLPSSGLGEALGGIVLGWIVAGAVSFMLHMFASRAGTLETLPILWRVALFLAAPLGALLGGYAGEAMAHQRRWAAVGLGVLVGAGAAALSLLFETRWRLVTLHVVMETGMLANYALCLLLGALGAWLSSAGAPDGEAHGASQRTDSTPGMSWEDLMYRDLLTRVRFNRDTAERLVEYERRLAPEADRYTLLRNAVERLDRDRRE